MSIYLILPLGSTVLVLGLRYAAIYNYEKALTFDCALPGSEVWCSITTIKL